VDRPAHGRLAPQHQPRLPCDAASACPDLELAGPAERRRSNFVAGIKHMPVRFLRSRRESAGTRASAQTDTRAPQFFVRRRAEIRLFSVKKWSFFAFFGGFSQGQNDLST
jgi:hypothetical protein